MTKLLIILSLCFVFAGELEVDGDLKVTGNIEAGTIDSLQQVIADLQAQIANLENLLLIHEQNSINLSNRISYIEYLAGMTDTPPSYLSYIDIYTPDSEMPTNYGHEEFYSTTISNVENIVGIEFDYTLTASSMIQIWLEIENENPYTLNTDGFWQNTGNDEYYSNGHPCGSNCDHYEPSCFIEINGDAQLRFEYDGNPPILFFARVFYTELPIQTSTPSQNSRTAQ